MKPSYLATELAGDPPEAVARWYKLQAGTYARVSDEDVALFGPADLKTELSVGTYIEFINGDGAVEDTQRIEAHWASLMR